MVENKNIYENQNLIFSHDAQHNKVRIENRYLHIQK